MRSPYEYFFRKAIIDKMFYCEVKEEEFIFKQGDNASSYLIIGIALFKKTL